MSGWNMERRKHPRVPLRWRAGIRREGQSKSTGAETLNLSCGGLYCVANEPFHPGECLEVALTLPEELDPWRRALRLRCIAVVVRAEPAGGHAYGIACSIEDYQVASGPERFGTQQPGAKRSGATPE